MDHGSGIATWGAATFWLFIAAAAVAGHWEKARRNAEKHETMRRIIEKTGTVDEAKLKELFNKRADWGMSEPGEVYRGLRIGGTVVLGVAAAIAVVFIGLGFSEVVPSKVTAIGLSAAAGVALMGIGLFVSSRFAEPPPENRS